MKLHDFSSILHEKSWIFPCIPRRRVQAARKLGAPRSRALHKATIGDQKNRREQEDSYKIHELAEYFELSGSDADREESSSQEDPLAEGGKERSTLLAARSIFFHLALVQIGAQHEGDL